MKQDFNIIRIKTSMDTGIGNRTKSWEHIDADKLEPGATFVIHGLELNVLTVDDEELKFTYKGKTYIINRRWQVLGTPEFDMSNERISAQGRYVFFFSKNKDIVCDWSDVYTRELVDQLNKNNDEGAMWKNIPVMREIIHEFKDIAPFRSENINPAYKAYYIACMLENDYIDKRETPLLYLSLCELYRLCRDYETPSDYDDFLEEHSDKYYFRG